MKTVKIGVPVWYGDGTLKQGVEKAVCLGFDYVEISLDYPWPDSLSKQELRQAIKIAREGGLEFAFHAPFAGIGLAHPRQEVQGAALKVMEKCMKFAHHFKPVYFNFHMCTEPPVTLEFEEVANAVLVRAVESVLILEDRARKYGMQLTLENIPGTLFGLSSQMTFLMHGNVKLCLDVGHVAKLHEELEALGAKDLGVFSWMKKFSKKIHVCHLHDCNHETDHLALGRGKLNISRILKAIRKTSAKYILLETFWNSKSAKITERMQKENLKMVRKMMVK